MPQSLNILALWLLKFEEVENVVIRYAEFFMKFWI